MIEKQNDSYEKNVLQFITGALSVNSMTCNIEAAAHDNTDQHK